MNLLRRLFVAALCCFAFSVNALTTAQYQTLKTYIASVPALSSKPMTSQGASEIAVVLNGVAVPDFWVWRTNVTRAQIYHGTSVDGTTWNWTTYINQSQGEQGAWVQMFMGDQADFSLPNLRAGVAAVFSGAGNQATQRTHILTIARRTATQAEKLLAVGTGSTASPATMTQQGSLTTDDVQQARELP